jgi:hypothetical protein
VTENSTVAPIALLRAVFTSEFVPRLFSGAETHEPALRFVAQMVHHTNDDNLIEALVGAALPESYSGDTIAELPDMIAGARRKGFDKEPNGESERQRKKPSMLDLLDVLFAKRGAELFHSDQLAGYVGIPTAAGGVIYAPVGSAPINYFLQELYFRATGRALKPRDRDDYTAHLSARAVFEGPREATYVRVGGDSRQVYYDLGRDDGAIVEVTADGYAITRRPAVKLIRMQGMKALPLPHAGETSYSGPSKFKQLLMLDDEQWPLVLAFLIGALRPAGPYAFLAVEGEQGSGKSVRCELCKAVIDPSVPMRTGLPNSVQDLMVITNHSHVVVFDNLSGIRSEMSDALAALSTKAGFQTRRLYTDAEVHTIEVTRPFMLNGIGDFIHRPDLMDRAIPIRLKAMPPDARRTEEEIRREFAQLLPELLHDLYMAVAHAVRTMGTTPSPSSIRMADAAHWAVAAEEGAGLPKGTILAALENAQASMQTDLATQDTLFPSLERVLVERDFEGRPAELLARLLEARENWNDRYFPTNAAQLSTKLRRIRPTLVKVGIHIEFPERTREGRHIRAWMTDEAKERARTARASVSLRPRY